MRRISFLYYLQPATRLESITKYIINEGVFEMPLPSFFFSLGVFLYLIDIPYMWWGTQIPSRRELNCMKKISNTLLKRWAEINHLCNNGHSFSVFRELKLVKERNSNPETLILDSYMQNKSVLKKTLERYEYITYL